MRSDQPIYVITVMTKSARDGHGYCTHGNTRIWGFWYDKEIALQALHENWTDMWEYTYNYAVLEEYQEGTIARFVSAQWFKFDRERDGYFEIEKPEWEDDSYGVAMG